MTLQFTKMHGAGNDFVVIDAIRQTVTLDSAQIRRIADRHFGVGCDQLLLVAQPTIAGADFRYRIFNADGGEVEQCGNGARCFMRFVHHHGLSDQLQIRVQTAAGIIVPRLEADGRVSVDMGAPRFAAEDIPFLGDQPATPPAVDLDVGGQTLDLGILSMGNPHAVLRVSDIDSAPVGELGAAIEHHPAFPNRVNAGFMQIIDPGHIRLRVFERGAGETLSCGTGACAAVVAGIRRGWLSSPVDVDTRGGRLTIAWEHATAPVWLTGPTAIVFEGELSQGIFQ
ncbi:MAG: diaminopimelate epimerase [Betaproteobacteria bacterium]|nr:diaminopimelate epimerase [Betaproteobacteria bacterium]